MRRPALLGLLVALVIAAGPASTAPAPYRPFTSDSEWNTPLPTDAPIDPNSPAMVAEFEGWGSYPTVGVSDASGWSVGVWMATYKDPSYTVDLRCGGTPSLNPVRIPDAAVPEQTADGEVQIYDVPDRKVVRLWEAVKSGSPGAYSWSACWSSVYFTSTRGIAVGAGGDPRNDGWRGIPGSVKTVRYDEVAAGQINHVIEVAVAHTAPCHVWPMDGDEGGSGQTLCEGQVLRISASIDLSILGLTSGCLVIAQAMQTYGVIVGDQTGGQAMDVGVENVALDGHGDWAALGVSTDCLSPIPFGDFQAITAGYDRPPPG